MTPLTAGAAVGAANCACLVARAVTIRVTYWSIPNAPDDGLLCPPVLATDAPGLTGPGHFQFWDHD